MIQRMTLAEQASDAIVELITGSDLEDGDALPSTAELAERFSVSVPVVREAIAGLAALGVLKRRQGKESVVSTPDADHLGRLLKFRIAHARVDDAAIQQYREVVEIGSARLAATNRDDEGIARLEEAHRAQQDAETDSDFHDGDVAFHAVVAHVSGNDLFELTLDAISPLLRRLRSTVWEGWVSAGGDRSAIIDAHAAVLECIRTGDADGAARAMEAHLQQARIGLEADGARTAADIPVRQG